MVPSPLRVRVTQGSPKIKDTPRAEQTIKSAQQGYPVIPTQAPPPCDNTGTYETWPVVTEDAAATDCYLEYPSNQPSTDVSMT